MPTYVLRLTPARPDLAVTMTEEEQAVMGAHAEHWGPWVADGSMVVFGPVLGADGATSWGLGVLEADDEDAVRAHAAADPVVTSGTGSLAVETFLGGFVRGA